MVWTAPRVHRADEPFAGAERLMLEGFLDWGRASLLRKCEGLTGEQLAIRPRAGLTGLASLGRRRVVDEPG